MFPIRSFIERFEDILDALDALAGECEADAAEDMDELNAELEDALMLLDEWRPEDGDEELAGALEDMKALAGDYRALAGEIEGLSDLAGQLDMAAGMALKNLEGKR